MDINKRQGRTKLKVSLLQLRKSGMFQEISQPEKVYHMTDRENLDSILNDGKIKSFHDYLTFFFSNTDCIPVYIQLTDALFGRQYRNTDGMAITAPPLQIENTIVLELVPRRKEKLEWYIEKPLSITNGNFDANNPVRVSDKESGSIINGNFDADSPIRIIEEKFSDCRVVHYGDFSFFPDKVKLIELSDIYANMSKELSDAINALGKIQSSKIEDAINV